MEMVGLVKRMCVGIAASILLGGISAGSASATVERIPGEGFSCPTPLLGTLLPEPPSFTSVGSEPLAYGACTVSGAVEGSTRFSPDGLTMTVSAKHRSALGEAAGFWSSTGPTAGTTGICLNEEVISVKVHRNGRTTEVHHEAGVRQTLRIGNIATSSAFSKPGPFTLCLTGFSPVPEHFEWISWITARAIKEIGVNASVTVRLMSVTIE
jgi:hypothetical protein